MSHEFKSHEFKSHEFKSHEFKSHEFMSHEFKSNRMGNNIYHIMENIEKLNDGKIKKYFIIFAFM